MRLKKWWFSFTLLLTSIVFSIFSFNRLPEKIQIKWTPFVLTAFEGANNTISSKLFLVLFPSLMLVLFLVLLSIPYFNRKAFDRIQNVYPLIVHSLLVFLLLTQGFIIANGFGYALDVNVYLLVAIGFLFTVLGNYIPRWRAGVNQLDKKYISSPAKFQRTTNIAIGRVFFYGGILLLLAVLIPAPVRNYIASPLIFVVSLAPAGIVLFQLFKHLVNVKSHG